MAAPGIPYNFYVTTANQQVLCQWAMSPGAVSYDLQRSTDAVTFTSIAAPAVTSYVDTTVVLGTQYFYQVAAVGSSGSSGYTTPISIAPAPAGEETLGSIRLQAKQRADRVDSNFVTLPEWNSYIKAGMAELYDLLITSYEDYSIAIPIYLYLDGSSATYALPNGTNQWLDASGTPFVPRPYYKLSGVDLAVNQAQNAYVNVDKFNFTDRNNYVLPNTSSTAYGLVNLRYRVMGSNIQFIPTPAGGQTLRMWYIPRVKELLLDTDTTDIGISGWTEYVIVRAAKYALDKEEADTTKLDQELLFLKGRIEESASNRDNAQPDTISNTARGYMGYGGSGSGYL